MISSGTVMYASKDCQESLTEAREYIARFRLTSDQVRLIRVDGQIRVVARKDVWNE